MRKNLSILPRPCGPAGCGVDQLDAELGAGPQQPRVDERLAVVDVDVLGDTPRRPAPGAARRPAARCPRRSPTGARPQPGMVVEEREQVGLAAADPRAVQRVAGPQLVRAARPRTGRTPAAGRRPAARSAQCGRSAAAGSAREGAQPGAGRAGSGATCAAVRSGFSRFSAAASSSTSAGVRGVHLPRRGHQRVEPARAPVPDPPVQRLAGTPHRLAERAGVLARRPAPAPAGPAARVDSAGSAASRISKYRNNPIAGPAPPGGPAHHLQRSSHLLHRRNGVDHSHRNTAGPPARARGATRVDQLPAPTRRQQPAGAHRRPATTATPRPPPGPPRAAAAAAAAATAATASANRRPGRAPAAPDQPPPRTASTVNTDRGPAPPASANRRSQPRTVAAGRPSRRRDRPVPQPGRLAASAAPITAATSARRSSAHTGSSTCVTPHPAHRDRRGRSRQPTRRSPRSTRVRARPHPASTPRTARAPQPPRPSRRSTTRASPPTVTTAPPSTRTALPALGQETDGRAAAYLNLITVAPHTKKGNPAGLPSRPSSPQRRPTAPTSSPETLRDTT